jgi:hypothetical protein
LAKNPVLHGRNKHIKARFHFIRENVNEKRLKVKHCPTEEYITNIFAKVVKINRFVKLRSMIGMMKLENLN